MITSGRFSRRRAFTYIELIIVVVVLVLLAGLSIRALRLTRERSLTKTCLDNERAIYTATSAYSSDSDDTLPMAHYDSKGERHTVFSWREGAGIAPLTWADLIGNYAPSARTYVCPSDETGSPIWPAGSRMSAPGHRLSYALNAYIYRQPGINRETSTGGGLTEIPFPGSTVLLAESASGLGDLLVTPGNWRLPSGDAVWARHMGGTNWVLADGHTAFHKFPVAWESVASSAWDDPKLAEKQPCQQWFPWLSRKKESW